MNADLAVRLTLAIGGVGVAISSWEYLTRPALLADHAIAGWPVGRSCRPYRLRRTADRAVDLLLRYPNVLVLVTLRLAAALAIVIGRPVPAVVCLGVLAASSILLGVRSPYGSDGADQLSMIIFVAAFCAAAIGTGGSRHVFLWFVAAQACCAYFIAGFAKLVSPVWRSGRALGGILGTATYGHRRLGPVVAAHPRAAWLAGWWVITLECAFPLVLLGDPRVTYAVLGLTLAMHLGILAFMRLNTFLWAFTATYPSVIYCTLR
ncbi:hypothetical protein [Streptomyces sp. CMB-StM0423]|uniref:hypothetical protein n=1 Tax=Streptomyces sp. CMB-StM0423 TaxID=2059884 RepID=UPI000C714547|nr:hypothetical protein [Streptomyces sp. CMB-StM0423]AUH40349.1 hypothetical protein CXR04_08880 [Streptomyces sp. CMB-StM0423]